MPFNKQIDGYQNEREFVDAMNGKLFKNIEFSLQEFLIFLYGDIDWEAPVYARLHYGKQKTDMIVWIYEVEKRISIKKGVKNSVHVESINSFIKFLRSNGMKQSMVDKLLYYHYGDGTLNGTGSKRVSSEEYKQDHALEIEEINAFFNQEKIIKEAVTRFILLGNNGTQPIDAILYGVKEDFIWITKEEILKVILSRQSIEATGLHFGSLFYQPMARCLNYNPKYEKQRHKIQIKWYHLSDDIIEMMNQRGI